VRPACLITCNLGLQATCWHIDPCGGTCAAGSTLASKARAGTHAAGARLVARLFVALKNKRTSAARSPRPRGNTQQGVACWQYEIAAHGRRLRRRPCAASSYCQQTMPCCESLQSLGYHAARGRRCRQRLPPPTQALTLRAPACHQLGLAADRAGLIPRKEQLTYTWAHHRWRCRRTCRTSKTFDCRLQSR
jgi:hypothetical protein